MKTIFTPTTPNANALQSTKNIVKNGLTLFVFLLFSMLTMSFGTAKEAPKSIAKITWESNCPTASFSVANNGTTVGTPIIFVNQSVDADSYHWDFGDGNSSCAENPTHAYNAAGTYTVILKAIVNGCERSFIGTVDTVMG